MVLLEERKVGIKDRVFPSLNCGGALLRKIGREKKIWFEYTKDGLCDYGIKNGGQVFLSGTSPFLPQKVNGRGYLDKLFCHIYGVVN